jgi:hypothetical protein
VYRLVALYRGLHDSAYDWEHKIKSIEATNDDDARKTLNGWKAKLPESIQVGKTQDEFKLSSIEADRLLIDSKGRCMRTENIDSILLTGSCFRVVQLHLGLAS